METHDFVAFLGFKILGFCVLYLQKGPDDMEVMGEFYEIMHGGALHEL